MSLLKCPKCGEYFSDSYHVCPFCAEDEEFFSDKKTKKTSRRVEKVKAPSILGPALLLVLLLVVGVGLFTILGGRDKEPTDTDPKQEDVTPTEQLALDRSEVTLEVGEERTLAVTGADSAEWTSSDEAVAWVDENGNVVAEEVGTTTITAVSGDQSAACVVTVVAGPDDSAEQEENSDLAIESIYGALSKNSDDNWEFSAAVGDSFGLSVAGTESDVEWSSSDEGVATVSEKGTFKATGSGNAVITAKVNGQTLKCDVRIG